MGGNTAWAFAALQSDDVPLMAAISSEAIAKMQAFGSQEAAAYRAASGVERLTDLLSVVHALAVAAAAPATAVDAVIEVAAVQLRMRAFDMDSTSEEPLQTILLDHNDSNEHSVRHMPLQ